MHTVRACPFRFQFYMKHGSSRQKAQKRQREESEEEEQRKIRELEALENDMNIYQQQDYDLSKYSRASSSKMKKDDVDQNNDAYKRIFNQTKHHFDSSKNVLEKQLLSLKLSFVTFLKELKPNDALLKDEVEQKIAEIDFITQKACQLKGQKTALTSKGSENQNTEILDLSNKDSDNELLDQFEEYGEEEIYEQSDDLESISQQQKRLEKLMNLENVPEITDDQYRISAVDLKTTKALGQMTGMYNVSMKEFIPVPISINDSKKLQPERLSSYLEEKAAERRKEAVKKRVQALQSEDVNDKLQVDIIKARNEKICNLDDKKQSIKAKQVKQFPNNIQTVQNSRPLKHKQIAEDQEPGSRPASRAILKNKGAMDRYHSRISRMKLRAQYTQHQVEKSRVFKKNKEQIINYQGQNYIDDRPIQKKDKR